MTNMLATADLCDDNSQLEHFQILEPLFQSYGTRAAFHGQITTLKLFEDNSLLKLTLQEPGDQRVLVIDGGGSRRCALMGDNLAQMLIDQDWAGIILYGCIRNCATLASMDVGIKALATHPLKSNKRNHGERDILITFAGVNFKKDHYLYADEDGIIVSEQNLS